LKVYEDGNSSNFKESEVYFSNKIIDKDKLEGIQKIEESVVKSIINIQ
jgi:hypothetical protein